jgi:hypothetical protein
VTQQISANLQAGAQSATASGNTTLATQLTQLSTDFKNASTSGQLPNVQDLAQAVGGGGHHHHHHRASASSTSTTTPTSTQSPFTQSQNATNSDSALAIIDNTLSSAGIQIG